MKKSKIFPNVERVTFRPENDTCPHCGSPLKYCHAVWRKTIITLTSVLYVSNLGFRCTGTECPYPRVVWRSAVADSLALRGYSFGLDVLVHVGVLRFTHNYTREQIHQELVNQHGIQISERSVQYLYEGYMRLLESTNDQKIAKVAPMIKENGGMVISLDGVQPERGHETLWVVREVLTGTPLRASVLSTSDTESIKRLLQPVVELGLPILGVISDAQSSIRRAVKELLPNVPHQLCQFHYLKNIAAPVMEEDNRLKAEIRKRVRGIKAVERKLKERIRVRLTSDRQPAPVESSAQVPLEPALEPEAQSQPVESIDVAMLDPKELTPTEEVILGYCEAVREAILEEGKPPLAPPGVQIYEDLERISESLTHCLKKERSAFGRFTHHNREGDRVKRVI